MKELLQFLLGIVLMIAGGVMFLKNVVVSDWGLLSSLFRIGGGVKDRKSTRLNSSHAR